MTATVALPNALDPTVVHLTYNGSGYDQAGHYKNYDSQGDIYTGGHIAFPASAIAAAAKKHIKLGGPFANIDAGLQLSEYPVANIHGSNNFVIERTNSIAQTMNPVAATPGVPPGYTNAPVANGPVNGPPFGFCMDGSYMLGSAWGVNDTQGVVLLHPGAGFESWTDSSTATSLAGSYPLDARYIKWNPSNPYYYEPNLNMRISLGILPGF